MLTGQTCYFMELVSKILKFQDLLFSWTNFGISYRIQQCAIIIEL